MGKFLILVTVTQPVITEIVLKNYFFIICDIKTLLITRIAQLCKNLTMKRSLL